MDKEKALLERRITILEGECAKYSYAYDVLMTYFDKLPDDIKQIVHEQLKEVDL